MTKARDRLMAAADLPDASEHSHQVAIFAFLATYDQFKFTFAIPNGGDRDLITAGKMKAEGVKRGVFDMCHPVPRLGYSGLYVELKRPSRQKEKNGGMSDEQIDFGRFILSQGYKAELCFGWRSAIDVFMTYEGIKYAAP